MVWKRCMENPVLQLSIRVSGSLRSKFPNGPAITMLAIKKCDDFFYGIAIGILGKFGGRHRHRNDDGV